MTDDTPASVYIARLNQALMDADRTGNKTLRQLKMSLAMHFFTNAMIKLASRDGGMTLDEGTVLPFDRGPAA